MKIIIINGVAHDYPDSFISHEQICALAGEPTSASVTYHGPKRRGHGLRREGMTYAGKSLVVEDGLSISCIVTGNA